MAFKKVPSDVDWLDAINGKSVADAIKYLETLPKDAVLDAWLDGGDQHGVELKSGVYVLVPLSPDEIYETRRTYILKRIQERQRMIDFHLRREEQEHADICQKHRSTLEKELEELNAQYEASKKSG